jgi:uncharacterized membrane protein YcjF (UPF0283 family)
LANDRYTYFKRRFRLCRESLLNCLLTARLGLAAVDVVLPFPFAVLSRPMLSDLMSDAVRGCEPR